MTATAASAARTGSTHPTMKDVARLAGVSLKTVSRALNDEPNVTPATTAKVHAAARELNYRPNQHARSLRESRPGPTIGLVIEDLADPFFSSLARGAERVAQERDHLLLIASAEESADREQALVASLLERRCAGLMLVSSTHDHAYLAKEADRGTPIVFIDRLPGSPNFDSAVIDNYGGAFGAVNHFIGLGHRRIGMIAGDPDLYTTTERVRGYRNTLEFAGIELTTDLLVSGATNTEQAEAAALSLLELPEPPTAILAGSNRIAVGLLKVLADSGATVAVVAFGDLELAARLATPLSVVAHYPMELGAQGARLLFARLEVPARKTEQVVLPTRYIARGSGEIPPSACHVPR